MFHIQKNKLLSELSTFGIGGPARYFAEVRSVDELQSAFKFCQQEKVPYIILGKGSNCLFDDRGFAGAVILNKIDFIEAKGPDIHVGAGYSFSLLGAQTARQGFAGLEFASGIPGTVGGAVFMNAGANGQETCDTLVSVDYLDESGLKILSKDKITFSYRFSSFQKWSGAIVGARFQLNPSVSARTKQIEIIAYRKKTQPLADMSAGCIFRNPAQGHAGALIDKSGLKGTRIGDAKISEMHANFIVNTSKASCHDVLSLIDLVKEQVKAKTGVELESEVRFIPFEATLTTKKG